MKTLRCSASCSRKLRFLLGQKRGMNIQLSQLNVHMNTPWISSAFRSISASRIHGNSMERLTAFQATSKKRCRKVSQKHGIIVFLFAIVSKCPTSYDFTTVSSGRLPPNVINSISPMFAQYPNSLVATTWVSKVPKKKPWVHRNVPRKYYGPFGILPN